MKKLAVLMVLVGLCAAEAFSQQCAPNGSWTRHLPAGRFSFTWYWDGNLNGAQFTRTYPPQLLSDAEARTLVRSAIASAMSSWCAATDRRISISDGGSSGDIQVLFIGLGSGGYGLTP